MSALAKEHILAAVAQALNLPAPKVSATVALLEAANTVPFVARYRKEVTGGLDEVQIRDIAEAWEVRTKLEERRDTILRQLEGAGQLTAALDAAVRKADTLAALEDIYRPFKPKRRTRAQIAQERGLGPLASLLVRPPHDESPEQAAARFVSAEKDVPTAADALSGARDILAEQVGDAAHVRAWLRRQVEGHAELVSIRAPKSEAAERTKFEEYYDYREPLRRLASHRYLAVRRGEKEGVLRSKVELGPERQEPVVQSLLQHLSGKAPASGRHASAWSSQLDQAVRDGVQRIALAGSISDVMADVKERCEREAAVVFARNVADLLLAAPFGPKAVLGIDPGLRTGSKCVVIDDRGRYGGSVVLHLTSGAAAHQRGELDLARFIQQHQPQAIAVGNGTGGRETLAFATQVVRQLGLSLPVVPVSESGASVYSASDLARQEFPDLDLTLRGAISIARRLQDPLAELVKVDPKSIGVGQYQHDIHQPLLHRKLEEVVESCVNRVGVDVNTASSQLLSHVAGIGPKLAAAIVAHREANGPFSSRRALLKVAGLGPKTFEQAAGFLRVRGGEEPLDASAVHPERYALVRQVAKDAGIPITALLGQSEIVNQLPWSNYLSAEVGEPTLADIRAELARPGRDPRAEFSAPQFREDVRELSDVAPGMELEGVVTNVTHFGAFVDVGVHQDGLVHISKLAHHFVRDPHEVVSPGDRIQVRVLEVDTQRKRLSLERI